MSSQASVAVQLRALDDLHSQKYRDPGQSKEEHAAKLAATLQSNPTHGQKLLDLFVSDRFLPAGRVQAAGGSSRNSSFFNCNVSGTIEDSMESIMENLKQAMLTLRLGTGIGYDFSNIRPRGAPISTLKSEASGPLSFMDVFDAGCKTIHMSHRRGAQMGMLRVDHPDILHFIDAKLEKRFSTFNLSVSITDRFMDALRCNENYMLNHAGTYYDTLPASEVWDKITRNAYNSAEPGMIFIDRINAENNLYYCETIAATNPCSEQPLPPYGLCLLGSFNLPKYLSVESGSYYVWNTDQLNEDVRAVVEAYDNIFERSIYALPQQQIEAVTKRRIGLGFTGIANAIEIMLGRAAYGDTQFNATFRSIADTFRHFVYEASVRLAAERGSFQLFDKEKYLHAAFIKKLPPYIRDGIAKYGIRNSHLISYAPCGTISLTGGNLSSGVEPVFYPTTKRKVIMNGGQETFINVQDYALREYGILGKTLEQCTIQDHLGVHEIAQEFCDSSVSKTINVPPSITFEDYQNVWLDAYERGAKGLTVYRPNEIRAPIITSGDCEGGECRLELVA